MKPCFALAALAVAACSTAGVPLPPPPPPPPPPPNLTSPIVFGQVFDAYVQKASDMSAFAFVWADNHRFGVIPGPQVGFYTEGYRSNYLAVEWFYATHPDWIEYTYDRKTPAYEFNDPRFTPLDIANPAVVAWKQAEIAGLVPKGNTWIDFDNIDLENSYRIAGHYTGTKAPCAVADQPACGGTWVSQYAQSYAPPDARWISDTKAYVATMTAHFHALGYKTMINNTEYIAREYLNPADHIALAALADGTLAEGFPMDICATDTGVVGGFPVDDQFDVIMQEAIAEAASGEALFMDGYLCNHPNVNTHEAAWATAAYLLAYHGPNDFLSLSEPSLTSMVQIYPDSMRPKIGQPMGVATGTRPYVRLYQGGIVALNPSSTATANFVIPPGSYVDQFGNPLASGLMVLKPVTAVVAIQR